MIQTIFCLSVHTSTFFFHCHLLIRLFLSGLRLIWFKIKNSPLYSRAMCSLCVCDFFLQLNFCHSLIFKIWLHSAYSVATFFGHHCLRSASIVSAWLSSVQWFSHSTKHTARSMQNLHSGAHCRHINRQSCFMLIIKKNITKLQKSITNLTTFST